MIGQRVSRGAKIELAGPLCVIQHEDALPRDVDPIADDDAVAFIEAV
jgi:hypothetical protein